MSHWIRSQNRPSIRIDWKCNQSSELTKPRVEPIIDMVWPNQPPNNMSTMPSHFKFGHSNTINVSFSNSKILFPHAHQNSVILPPPIPAFMQLPSTSSRVNSSQQQSSNNPFCNNTSLKAPISSNNDFILSKMSNIPAASTNGNQTYISIFISK